MKKILMLFLMAGLLFGLSAAGSLLLQKKQEGKQVEAEGTRPPISRSPGGPISAPSVSKGPADRSKDEDYTRRVQNMGMIAKDMEDTRQLLRKEREKLENQRKENEKQKSEIEEKRKESLKREEEARKKIVEFGQSEEQNLTELAEKIERAEPVNAAALIQKLIAANQADDAAKILAEMGVRPAGKVLDELLKIKKTGPAMVDQMIQLVNKYKGLKRPLAKTGAPGETEAAPSGEETPSP